MIFFIKNTKILIRYTCLMFKWAYCGALNNWAISILTEPIKHVITIDSLLTNPQHCDFLKIVGLATFTIFQKLSKDFSTNEPFLLHQ